MFVIFQILFATREVLKIGKYHSDIPQPGNIQSRDAFELINEAKIFDGMYNSLQLQVLFQQNI